MKLLIDENLPKRLKLDFLDYEIYTVSDKKWNGCKNEELLKLMIDENFKVLLTFDKNLQFQQNFLTYPISVLILNAQDNSYLTIKLLVPEIKKVLDKTMPIGPIEISLK